MDKSKSYSIFKAQNLPLSKWMHFGNFENQFWKLVLKKNDFKNNFIKTTQQYQESCINMLNYVQTMIQDMQYHLCMHKINFWNENNKHATHKQ